MDNKWLLAIVFSALVIGLFTSCEEDFEINAPYSRIPIIYGLLDAEADTQFVMINRSYLVDGNALDYTTVEDSSLYDEVSAILRYGDGDNDFVVLDSIRLDDKDLDGIFFAPTHRVYYARTSDIPPLDDLDGSDNTLYELEIMADDEIVGANTRVPYVQAGNISAPISSGQVELRFVDQFSQVDGSAYRDIKFEFDIIDNADRHEASLIFHYQDSVPGALIDRAIEIPFGSVNASDISVGSFEIEREGRFFYEQVAARIVPDENVIYRKIGDVDFILTVAGEDLSTYLAIGDPVSDVGQERPSFSNINDGEGVGIFSSKASFTLTKSFKKTTSSASMGLTSGTMKELILGELTRDFCFCDPFATNEPLFQCDEDYTCP